jgi:hypothetical protein
MSEYWQGWFVGATVGFTLAVIYSLIQTVLIDHFYWMREKRRREGSKP